jgi:hypothetical protein
MDAWSYFEEQRLQFLELAGTFVENSHRYQAWQHFYIKYLHQHIQHHSEKISPPEGILLEAETVVQSTAINLIASSTDLSDEQWQAIAPLLIRHKHPGRPGADARTTLNGILYVLLHRCPWRAMPPCYGNFVTCWRRLLQWQNDGTWDRMLPFLPPQLRPPRALVAAHPTRQHPAAS